MTVFRRGTSYLVYFSETRAYLFDAPTGRATAEAPARGLTGSDGRDWLPVLESEALPQGLRDRLVLRFPTPKDPDR